MSFDNHQASTTVFEIKNIYSYTVQNIRDLQKRAAGVIKFNKMNE